MYTVMLIPGLVSDDIVWADLAGALAARQGIRVVTADLTQGSDIRDWAARLLDEAGGPVIAIGHSMGGRVALEMAHQAPGRVKGLVLANTGHGPKKDGEEVKRHQMIDMAHRDLEEMIASWLPGMLDAARVTDADLIAPLAEMVRRAGPDVHERQIHALMGRPNATSYLAQVTCPVLALTGAQDRWSPVAQHEEIVAAVADGTLVVIDNAGHFAPVERPAAVTRAITHWIDERFPRD